MSPSPEPFFREAGSPGSPGVVCLHANASSSSQWRGLLERLAPRHQALAPDGYGAGKSADWHSDREIGLRDEAAFMEPVLRRAGAPLALVGHSHGAAVALMAALAEPRRVRALALYEPTLFALLGPQADDADAAAGIRAAVAASAEALDRGSRDEAARHFIDYWMGPGSWAATPDARKPAIAASMVNVRRWAHALMTEATPPSAFATLDMPVLLMVGQRSPASSRAVAQRLAATLPQVEVLAFEALGHMGPITHPDLVNEAIERFLDRTK